MKTSILTLTLVLYFGSLFSQSSWSPAADAALANPDIVIELNFITDFGGNPDGVASNIDAFALFNEYVQTRKKNIILTIPDGTYIIGKSILRSSGEGYSNIKINGEASDCSTNCLGISNITIKGSDILSCDTPKVILKYDVGLRYGSFTDASGTTALSGPLHSASGSDDMTKAFTLGFGIYIVEAKGITIKNITLDGNLYSYSTNNMNSSFPIPRLGSTDNPIFQSNKINIGGRYSSGIQLPHTGISITNSENVTIENVVVRRFGLDGINVKGAHKIMCKNTLLSASKINIINSTIDHNGRNGITLTEGNNILIKKCRITNTGRGFASPPGSGIDFEDDANGNFGPSRTVLANILIDSTLIWNSLNAQVYAKWGTADLINLEFRNCDIIAGLEPFSAGFDVDGYNDMDIVKQIKIVNSSLMGKNFFQRMKESSRIEIDNCQFIDRYYIGSCLQIKSIGDGTSDEKYNRFVYYNLFNTVANVKISNSAFNIFNHSPILLRSPVGASSHFLNNKIYSTDLFWTSRVADFWNSQVHNLEYHHACTPGNRPAKLYPGDGGVGNTYSGISLYNRNISSEAPNYIAPTEYIFPYEKYYCNPFVDSCIDIGHRPAQVNDKASSSINHYTIFPNPTKDILNIEGETTKINAYSIYNTEGKEIKIGKLKKNQIEISDLSSGLYILVLHFGNDIESHKFTKL